MNSISKIEYPAKPSEFDIQAELWRQLRSQGFDVRGEVSAHCKDYGRIHRTNLDLVVFNSNREACLIIEVKDHPRPKETAFRVGRCLGSRQQRRYSSSEFPCGLVLHAQRYPTSFKNLSQKNPNGSNESYGCFKANDRACGDPDVEQAPGARHDASRVFGSGVL